MRLYDKNDLYIKNLQFNLKIAKFLTHAIGFTAIYLMQEQYS